MLSRLLEVIITLYWGSSILVLVVVLMCGGLILAAAAESRSMRPIYVALVALAYGLSGPLYLVARYIITGA